MKGIKRRLSLPVGISAILVISLTAACGGGREPQELTIPVTVDGESMEPETVKIT